MVSKIPGTNLDYQPGEGMFSKLVPLIRFTDGLTLSQVTAITGLEGSTIQNWVKRGFVASPVNKKYRERQLARILTISCLRDAMQIDKIGELMACLNGSANDENDDIIPEEKLYDCFCEVITASVSGAASSTETDEIIDEVISSFESKNGDPKDKIRLKNALRVMTLAYNASALRRSALEILDNMKKERNENNEGKSN